MKSEIRPLRSPYLLGDTDRLGDPKKWVNGVSPRKVCLFPQLFSSLSVSWQLQSEQLSSAQGFQLCIIAYRLNTWAKNIPFLL